MHLNGIEAKLFRYGMWWRIFYGGLRIVIGLILLRVIDMPFSEILTHLLGYELSDESSLFLFSFVGSFLQSYPFTVTLFLAGYLLFWGMIDIILSVSLLRHKLWAFPLSLVLIAFFIVYAIYRFFHTDSLILLAVIILDIIIFWLIKTEYIKRKNNLKSLS